MTDQIIARLDRVKALADGATDGPWEAREGDYGHEVIADDPEPGDLVIAHEVTQGHDDGQFDAEFIAAMRTDAVWMEAVIRAVMEKHAPDEHNECTSCHTDVLDPAPWPCPTVRDMQDAMGGVHE
ncbi:hypothetical protein [Nesterenkonia suensis]